MLIIYIFHNPKKLRNIVLCYARSAWASATLSQWHRPSWSTGLPTRMATWQRRQSTRSNWRPWKSKFERYFSSKFIVWQNDCFLGCEDFRLLCWTVERELTIKTSRRSDWKRRKQQKRGSRWFFSNILFREVELDWLILDIIQTFEDDDMTWFQGTWGGPWPCRRWGWGACQGGTNQIHYYTYCFSMFVTEI